MSLSTGLFDYPLPAEAIAQVPATRRDGSRLMVVDRKSGGVEHRVFSELPTILAERGLRNIDFFRNNAKVIKARFWLRRKTGAEVELLLLRPSTDSHKWWCLAKPLKKISEGEALYFEEVAAATLVEKSPTGEALFAFLENPLELSEKIGKLPLPPYIARQKEDPRDPTDTERYQTVYARERVAAAAPTAGLHFTPELLGILENQGHAFYDVTLHVGLDTFRPIATESVEEHKIHTESYEISPEAAEALQKKEGFKLAVGTTSLRTLEDYARKGYPEGHLHSASLFIYPPQVIQSVDALITNFHLPKSTLMCLVAAFLKPKSMDGIAWLKQLYAEALAKGYRFYSYGDAMLIL